ncbi:MAG: riboflavin biosynthesis protein [Phycisphaerae bacterium]
MQVIHGIEAARLSGVVLTIGNFDGVHRGHRALLETGVELARRGGTRLAVMTFEPHPAAILTPDRVPPTLTPPHEKLRLMAAAGAEIVVVVESRPEFFALSAGEFIHDVIVSRFRPRALVEGKDFRFGRHRQGDLALLRAAGAARGFEVHVVEPIRAALGGQPDTVISSSLIRHLLGSGNVDRAAECLGRPYALFGTVQRGSGRGRTLGFPTANLAVEDQLIPAEGVYVGRAAIEGHEAGEWRVADGGGRIGEETRSAGKGESQLRAAAISIGRTPTFESKELLVEAHLLDFDGDLYGRRIRLEFLEWLRAQQRFDSVGLLKDQIARDVKRAREPAATW